MRLALLWLALLALDVTVTLALRFLLLLLLLFLPLLLPQRSSSLSSPRWLVRTFRLMMPVAVSLPSLTV